MKSKTIFMIIGGFFGFMMGILGGGFVGLIIGGTLLGSFNIYETIGLEGYELAAYIGAGLGAFFDTPIGIKLGLMVYQKLHT